MDKNAIIAKCAQEPEARDGDYAQLYQTQNLHA